MKRFDPLLGWTIHPNQTANFKNSLDQTWEFHSDEKGSRLNPHPSKQTEISIYGDSFAFCSEVCKVCLQELVKTTC